MTEELFSIYYGGISKIIPDKSINIKKIREELSNITIKNLIDEIQKQKTKEERNKLKKYLSYVTPAGVFAKRNKKNIISQSGYAPIDIDNIKNLNKLKSKLKKDPYIHLMFISPSGNGLKLFIKIPKSIEEYSSRVSSFYNYLHKKYLIKSESLDSTTRDISRACFLSYDPNHFYNPESKIYKDIDIKKVINIGKTDNTRSAVEYRHIIKLLYLNKSKEYIFQSLENSSKWSEATEQYKNYTFDKAKDYVKYNQPSADIKIELINTLVEDIIKNFYIHTVRSDKNPDVYIYKNGIYIPNGKVIIHEYIGKSVGKYYSKIFGDKVIEKIIVKTYIDEKELFEEPDPKFICVENGILNIFTGELSDFTPKLRFFNKIPVEYNNKIHPEHTINHFNKVLHPQDVPLMQELYGFLLYRQYKFQKAFIFSGDGANGKSITTSQIKSFLGIENCTNLSLELLEGDKGHFMKASLHKKLANLADDIGKSKLNETRTFKECTGGGIMTVDKKFQADPITFVNYAKMIFNANQIPIIEDDSDGLWRRWIFIRFDKTFLSKNNYEKRKKNKTLYPNHELQDNELMSKLNNPKELSGVLNWAIDGFKRLIKNNDFSYYKSLTETRTLMRKYSSSVLAFAHDCLQHVPNVEQYEKVSDVYEKYVEYCFTRKKKLSPETEQMFRKLLKDEVVIQTKRIMNARELRCMYVKLKKIPEDI